MTTSDPPYSMEEVVIAKMALRRAAGVPVDRLALAAFVDAVWEEIETLRDGGFADDEIAAVIQRAIGRAVTEEAITECRPHHRKVTDAAPAGRLV